MPLRALSLPGCACRGAFQLAVMARLAEAGERFDVIAGASSGSICGAVAVAGLAHEGPDMMRALARTPIASPRYLRTERSIFGMSAILRDALRRFVPEERIHGAETELLVATTRARRLPRSLLASRSLAVPNDALAVHSNRARRDMHDVILASCTIPIVYASLPTIDGEVHVDGALADNTLLGELVARGADDITVITPDPDGGVSRTMFGAPLPLRLPPHVRLRVLHPSRPLRIGRFDFAPGPLEEALATPHLETIVAPSEGPSCDRRRSAVDLRA